MTDHMIGLTWLALTIQSAMKTKGIIPPPSMAKSIMMDHPMLLELRSLFPKVAKFISLIRLMVLLICPTVILLQKKWSLIAPLKRWISAASTNST